MLHHDTPAEINPAHTTSNGRKRVVVCTYSDGNHCWVDSASLIGACGQLEIRHADDRYWLRRTQSGKLILTK